jgi:hypothetical protein
MRPGLKMDGWLPAPPQLPVVMMTMMVTNCGIGGSNRAYQNSERDNRKQNATNLH